MEIKFTKNGEKFVSEFTATADFNLHLEGVVEGKVKVYQRSTAGGEYAYVRAATPYPSFSKVYDYDFSALVYPKYIKVVTDVDPEYAEVVTDGEVTEIKSQSKEIEVTSNGTTEVTPDTGFAYLNSVKVKTNVAQSGGGSASSVVYLDITQVITAMGSQSEMIFVLFPGILSVKESGQIKPPSFFVLNGQYDTIRACAILPNFRGSIDFDNDINSTSVIEQLKQMGAFEITEEEFYNFNVEE